jgi:hypothetical protein
MWTYKQPLFLTALCLVYPFTELPVSDSEESGREGVNFAPAFTNYHAPIYKK